MPVSEDDISFVLANSASDLTGILTLQKANLKRSLSDEEIHNEGFVTVDHNLPQLTKLNNLERHVVGKIGEEVVCYLLAMTNLSSEDVPELAGMFNLFDSISFKGNKISSYCYIVVGQACVHKRFRAKGVFDECYLAYKHFYSGKYELAITEIASTNPRSLKAHARVGFVPIYSYADETGTNWVVVAWDWKSKL